MQQCHFNMQQPKPQQMHHQLSMHMAPLHRLRPLLHDRTAEQFRHRPLQMPGRDHGQSTGSTLLEEVLQHAHPGKKLMQCIHQ